MDPNIIIVLLFTLFAGGHSLECYECLGMGGCVSQQKTQCDTGAYACVSGTAITSAAGAEINMEMKGCEMPQKCVNGSFNFGVSRTTISMQCCNRDFCNTQRVPDYSSNRPNGKQCYFCNEKGCYNKLNCVGTEDSCLTAKATSGIQSVTIKGCASKSLCDTGPNKYQDIVKDISCCQGNLCNSAKSITYSLLILSWPYISYIMLH